VTPSAGYGQQISPPPPDESVVKLPVFGVTGTPVDRYNASEASSAARTAGTLLDSPSTTYVMTQAMFEDINPNSMFDLTNYLPGVTAGRATCQNDRMVFRGFENFSTTVDNFSRIMIPYMYGQFTNFITAFVDHAEVVMGPDAITSPTGAPGGTLAVITKSPQFTRATDVSVQVGNFNANKASVDTTGPLGDSKHMAYRFIASYQDADTYLPGRNTYQAVAAEFTYKFSDTAKLTFKYFGTDQRLKGAEAAGGANGEVVSTVDTVRGMTLPVDTQPGFMYNGYNGNAPYNQYITRENTAELELTAALGQRVNMRLSGQVYYSHWNTGISIRPAPSTPETWDPATGVEIGVTPINPLALVEIGDMFDLESRQIQFQNDYVGKFDVSGVGIEPLVGWAYQQGSIPVWFIAQDKNVPTVNLYQQYVSTPVPDKSAFTTANSNTPENAFTLQIYGYLRAAFLHDRLFVTVGGARTYANVNDYSIPYINEAGISSGNFAGTIIDKTFSSTKNPLMPSVKPWHDAYNAGVVGKVLPNVSVYYNYSTSAALASNAPMWQNGVQNEFGVKTAFLNNRIAVSADHFEITQSNVSYQNPLFNLGQSTILTIYENLASRGYEFSVRGGVTDDLSVIFSYANTKLRDAFGRRQRNIPDTTVDALLDYHFNVLAKSGSKDSDVFVGVINQGDIAGETVAGFTALGVPEQPGYFLPAFTVVNAGAGFKWSNMNFNLNVNNLLNKKAWYQAQARSSVAPLPGTQVAFTVTVHFR